LGPKQAVVQFCDTVRQDADKCPVSDLPMLVEEITTSCC